MYKLYTARRSDCHFLVRRKSRVGGTKVFFWADLGLTVHRYQTASVCFTAHSKLPSQIQALTAISATNILTSRQLLHACGRPPAS